MSRARPIVLLAALLALAATALGFAVFSSVKFVGGVVVDRAILWGRLLEAEFLFLCAWRFFQWTLLPITVLLGRRTMKDEPQIKKGGGVRLALIVATGVLAAFFPVLRLLLGLFFAIPDWYGQIGYPVAAVLMFCAFTYPWQRTVEPCAAPNGGAATHLGDTKAAEGPPSVS